MTNIDLLERAPMKVAVLGEVLWDLVGESRFLGGAPLNFAFHLHALGHEPMLISAVGDDEPGSAAIEEILLRGLSTRFIHRDKAHPTGTVSVNIGRQGMPEYIIHRPAAYDFPSMAAELRRELIASAPQWVYFGTLQQMSAQALSFNLAILEGLAGSKKFYDLNLRPNWFSPELLRQLLQHADVLKLNDEEAHLLSTVLQLPEGSREVFCRRLQQSFSLEGVCITHGPRGCSLLVNDVFLEQPGYLVSVADTIGAGDAFSAALLHGLQSGWSAQAIAEFANRLGALVASLPGGAPQWTHEQLDALARRGTAP